MSDNFVAETAARIFADLADPQDINKARDDGWKAALWQALAENGLTLAWVPEERFAPGVLPVMGLNGVFVAAWLLSALLLFHSHRGHRDHRELSVS